MVPADWTGQLESVGATGGSARSAVGVIAGASGAIRSAGSAAPGIYHDGTLQRIATTWYRVDSRLPQHAHPDCDHARFTDRATAGGIGDHRNDLRTARHWTYVH